ncbi:MAG: hypothetical protein WBW87_02085 [Candidatus Cybelea sp.]
MTARQAWRKREGFLLGLSLFVASALTACASSNPPIAAAAYRGNPLRTLSVARATQPQTHDSRRSWFSPEIKKSASLLFVSDAGTGDVYLYKLPSLKVAARVTGFTQPQGECSDDRGDVWVTDTNAKTIYELSHAGQLKGTLTDAAGYPVGCAWDRRTGSLAVMNLFGLTKASGNLLVYPYATGNPVRFTNPAQYLYYFGDFDDKGNLFFDGVGTNGKFMLSELVNRTTVRTVAVTGGTIFYPGMVQWSGSDLVVGDQSCGNANTSCVYQLSVAKKTATIEKRIKLDDSQGKPVCDLVQGVVIGAGVIAGSDNDFCGYEAAGTYLWPYPSGGNPAAVNLNVDSVPVGAALSTTQRLPESRGGRTQVRSWMQPAVSNADLLYISDGNGEVTVYRYWQRTLAGLLTGFKQPLGLCADAKSDVFVADYGAQQILEYAHGATKPIRTISDAPYDPYGCSVDPVTGSLAVANAGGSSGEGNIAVYADASSTPTYYTDSHLSDFQSCVYDDGGNLLVTNGNLRRSGVASFAWLPHGGTKLIDLNVPGPDPYATWQYVQGLQWDGKYFVIDDYSTLNRIALLKGQAFYVGATYLNIEDPGLYWIYDKDPMQQGTQVVGAESGGSVEYFGYPAGGDGIHYISHGIDAPYGLTISLKKH